MQIFMRGVKLNHFISDYKNIVTFCNSQNIAMSYIFTQRCHIFSKKGKCRTIKNIRVYSQFKVLVYKYSMHLLINF